MPRLSINSMNTPFPASILTLVVIDVHNSGFSPVALKYANGEVTNDVSELRPYRDLF